MDVRGFRATAGEALGYWHERIREVKGDSACVIAMGDFNDEPYDASIPIHANATRERGDVTRGRFGTCLRVMLWHNGANNLLPMRTGELAFPVLMGRWFGVRVAVAVPTLLWFRCLDLWSLVLIAGLVLGPPRLGWGSVATAAVLWTALPALARLWRDPAARFCARRDGRLARALQRLVEGIPASGGGMAHTVGWTLANWSLKMAAYAGLLAAVGGLSWSRGLLGALGGELSSVQPVHGIAGAGTYEAGVVAALLPFGVDLETALPAAVSLHLFVLATGTVGIALAAAAGSNPDTPREDGEGSEEVRR